MNRKLKKVNKSITIILLCQLAGVSESGYYKWLSTTSQREFRLNNELSDYKLIKTIFFSKEEAAGYRTIVMNLLSEYGVIMNPKKVKRIMKKYNLICKIRKQKTYGNTFNQHKIENTYDNLLKTTFDCQTPAAVYHTDITYLKYAHGLKTAYLSVVKDQATREIVGYSLAQSLEISFVLETLDQLKQLELAEGAIIHSDQGVHYTSNHYKDKIIELGLKGSMSARGRCVDNAPVETFFGHLKDEISLKKIKDYQELIEKIDNYIYDYNHHRPQWTLKKMTPINYRNHLIMKISA